MIASNLKCCCGGDAQILNVYVDTASFAREIGLAGVKVLWACLRCGKLEHSYVTLQELSENEKIYGKTA